MSNDTSAIVQKVWNYAHVLKNAGVGYGDYIQEWYELDKAARRHLKTEALRGTDIVPGVVSLCAMNLYLHGIGGKVAAASRRSSSNKNQRRDASATFKKFTYDEIIARDKANLDIFWLKDESLEDTENLPPPAELAAEIIESLEAALEEFRGVEEVLTTNK